MRMMNGKNLLVLIFVVLFIAIGVALMLIFKPVKSLESSKPDYTFSASELFDYFSDDEEEANQKFIGKTIQLNGTIHEINREHGVVLLKTDDLFSGVSCKLAARQKIAIDSLLENQEIIIIGECSGKLLDVMMNNCFVLEIR